MTARVKATKFAATLEVARGSAGDHSVELGELGLLELQLGRERCQTGPKYASWPARCCGNMAVKGAAQSAQFLGQLQPHRVFNSLSEIRLDTRSQIRVERGI